MEERPYASSSAERVLPDADARLVEGLRTENRDAGYRFVHEYYPGVYRYLVYLTGRAELAQDLTQETFLQAWRHLHGFDGRGSLRAWLHRIAHREFLQALRCQRVQAPLEAASAVAEPETTARMAAVELRELLGKLPLEQREVMTLHYLEGYSSTEIARIVGAPAGTVRYWLAAAREYLRREFGEGDLAYLNEAWVPMRQWAWLPLDQMRALEARLGLASKMGKGEEMERREFLRQTAAGAVGLLLTDSDRDVIDNRLTQKVTLSFKGTALSDVCEQLRSDTGVRILAGQSVGDEKVTLFCEKLALRDVLRQLSRPFGYAWLRSGKSGEYKYELVQDLRSQLLEEELRNRDRHAALLALEQEMERFRPYLHLTPDEIVVRAKTAPPAEKKLLEKLGGGDPRSGLGWGPIQMYFRLSSQDQAALRSGEWLYFSEGPRPGERPMPQDIARGVIQSWRKQRFVKDPNGYKVTGLEDPDGVPATAVPGLRASVSVALTQSDLGGYGLQGLSGWYLPGRDASADMCGPYALGRSPKVLQPDNATANARFARDPDLRARVTTRAEASCHPAQAPDASAGGASEPDVTTADVLEALHRTTGMPIVADYYTRLHKPQTVSVRNLGLFDALNTLADAMRLRWNKDGSWLQFRSTSYYDDRLKEVPNRLLARWAAARRNQGMLTLDDLVEIAQLSDAQLGAEEMATGAKECWGLAEWDLARNHMVVKNLRFLAEFTPEQRREAMSATGLPFTKMTLAQQQGFLARAFPTIEPFTGTSSPTGTSSWTPGLQSLEELAGAALRVDYRQPGWFEWRPPGASWLRWMVPSEPSPKATRVLRPVVRARTREEVLEALRQLDPKVREAARWIAVRFDPRMEATYPADDAQIVPTELDLTTIYMPGVSSKHRVTVISTDNYSGAGW